LLWCLRLALASLRSLIRFKGLIILIATSSSGRLPRWHIMMLVNF
jgi:hypothetical protein